MAAAPTVVLVILPLEFTYYLIFDPATRTRFLFINQNLNEPGAKFVYANVFEKLKEDIPDVERAGADS